MEEPAAPLSYGELRHFDGLIGLLQEQGLTLGDSVKAQSDVCCCGAITCETKGKIVFNEHDREIIREIVRLEHELEASPTLGELIEIRGQLLHERTR
jgi:hypothetical protein